MESALSFHIQKSLYNCHTKFMVYFWEKDSYLNNEPVQISDVVLINASYGSSGSLGSRVRSKGIVHNIYTGIRRKFCSKPTPIHRPVNKSELVFHNQELNSVSYQK